MTGTTSAESSQPKRYPADLVGTVVGLVPGLTAVLEGALRFRKLDVHYPISTRQDLVDLIELDDDFIVSQGMGNGTVTRREATEGLQLFFPESFFPIRDEQDLLLKAYLTSVRALQSHKRDERSKGYVGRGMVIAIPRPEAEK